MSGYVKDAANAQVPFSACRESDMWNDLDVLPEKIHDALCMGSVNNCTYYLLYILYHAKSYVHLNHASLPHSGYITMVIMATSQSLIFYLEKLRQRFLATVLMGFPIEKNGNLLPGSATATCHVTHVVL